MEQQLKNQMKSELKRTKPKRIRDFYKDQHLYSKMKNSDF